MNKLPVAFILFGLLFFVPDLETRLRAEDLKSEQTSVISPVENVIPETIKKLFVRSYIPIQLQLIFKGYNENQPGSKVYEYQIFTPTLSKRLWQLKEGGTILVDENTKYVVGKFREKIKPFASTRTSIEEVENFSELDLYDTALNQTITLTFLKPQNSDRSLIEFGLKSAGEIPVPAKMMIGQKFKLGGFEYQLRRAAENSAVILDLKTQKEFTVSK